MHSEGPRSENISLKTKGLQTVGSHQSIYFAPGKIHNTVTTLSSLEDKISFFGTDQCISFVDPRKRFIRIEDSLSQKQTFTVKQTD